MTTTRTQAQNIRCFSWAENVFFLVLKDGSPKTEQPSNGAAYLAYLRENHVRELKEAV